MKSSFEKKHTFGEMMKGCERVLKGVEEDNYYETLERHAIKVKKYPKEKISFYLFI